MKLTATPNTRIAAITANAIAPRPPVDGRREPVLFAMSMILSVSTVPSLEIVQLFTSASALFSIVTLIGAVSLLYPHNNFVQTNVLDYVGKFLFLPLQLFFCKFFISRHRLLLSFNFPVFVIKTHPVLIPCSLQ